MAERRAPSSSRQSSGKGLSRLGPRSVRCPLSLPLYKGCPARFPEPRPGPTTGLFRAEKGQGWGPLCASSPPEAGASLGPMCPSVAPNTAVPGHTAATLLLSCAGCLTAFATHVLHPSPPSGNPPRGSPFLRGLSLPCTRESLGRAFLRGNPGVSSGGLPFSSSPLLPPLLFSSQSWGEGGVAGVGADPAQSMGKPQALGPAPRKSPRE